jgi:hypothetical protein
MSRRERSLLFLVGGVVGLAALALAFQVVIMGPIRELDRQIGGLRLELNKIAAERRTYFANEDQVKALTAISFSDDTDKASAKSGEMLTRLILQSGLPEADFTRLPVGPRRLRGANEIGWNIQGEGPLMQVINLLFQLQESPYLHRIENVTVTPGDSPSRVRVRFRFLTLVMEPAPAVEWREPAPKFTLDSLERRAFDMIVQRDILRPYVKRPPTPPASPGTVAPGADPGQAGKPLPGPESLKVVSLTDWQGAPEVHVRDLVNQRTLNFKPGDPLAGGTLVMVDYRPMPAHDRPGLLSHSRAILRIGSEYWAVERGRSLVDKYKLAPEQWPESLPKP